MNIQRALAIAQHAMIGLLIAAHCVLLTCAFVVQSASDVVATLLDSAIPSAVSLLLTWGVMRGRSLCGNCVFRCVCIGLALVIVIVIVIIANEFLGIILVGQIGFLAPALIGLRLWRFRIEPVGELDQKSTLQFSIRGLFVVTSVAACLLGGLRVLRSMQDQDLVGLIEFGLAFGIIAVSSLWLVLRIRRMWIGNAATLALAALCGLLLAYELTMRQSWIYFVGYTCMYAIMLSLSFAVLRLCDFRLTRIPRSADVPTVDKMKPALAEVATFASPETVRQPVD